MLATLTAEQETQAQQLAAKMKEQAGECLFSSRYRAVGGAHFK